MKPVAYLSAGLLGLVLSLNAAAAPITRTVSLSAENGTSLGSFNIDFENTTPAGLCGAACTMSNISIFEQGIDLRLGQLVSLAVVLDPATFISSWAATFRIVEVGLDPQGELSTTSVRIGYTGNVDRTLGVAGFLTQTGTTRRDVDFDFPGTWTSETPPQAIPEPPTAALALAGLGLVRVVQRRRDQLRA